MKVMMKMMIPIVVQLGILKIYNTHELLYNNKLNNGVALNK